MAHDHDLSDAEDQLREALDPKDIARAQLNENFEKMVRIILAIVLADERKPDAAVAMGAPLCAYASENHGDIYETMQEKGICR